MPSGVRALPSLLYRCGSHQSGLVGQASAFVRLEVAPSTMRLIRHGFKANLTTIRKYSWRGEARTEGLFVIVGYGDGGGEGGRAPG